MQIEPHVKPPMAERTQGGAAHKGEEGARERRCWDTKRPTREDAAARRGAHISVAAGPVPRAPVQPQRRARASCKGSTAEPYRPPLNSRPLCMDPRVATHRPSNPAPRHTRARASPTEPERGPLSERLGLGPAPPPACLCTLVIHPRYMSTSAGWGGGGQCPTPK